MKRRTKLELHPAAAVLLALLYFFDSIGDGIEKCGIHFLIIRHTTHLKTILREISLKCNKEYSLKA